MNAEAKFVYKGRKINNILTFKVVFVTNKIEKN